MKRQNKVKKAGRPPLPKGDAKVGTLRVRFEPDDLKLVTAAANGKRQTLSEWVRKAAIAAAEVQMFKGTLYEAIEDVLLKREGGMATTSEISEEIAQNGSYTRKDGKAARANQINARVRQHDELFEFASPGVVRLRGKRPANSEMS